MVCVYVINFLIGVGAVGYVLNEFGDFLQDWEKALYVYYIGLGLCGLALAYWVSEDEEKIERLVDRILKLEKKSS